MGIFELLFKGLFSVPEKKSSGNPFALKGDIRPYRRAMIKNIRRFFKQEKYNGIFKKAFFSRFSKGFMKIGCRPAIKEEDINEGVKLGFARYVFDRAMCICSLRSNQEENIEKMRRAEAKRIVMKVSRVGTVDRKYKLYCPKAPKEKKFRPFANIWYKAEF